MIATMVGSDAKAKAKPSAGPAQTNSYQTLSTKASLQDTASTIVVREGRHGQPAMACYNIRTTSTKPQLQLSRLVPDMTGFNPMSVPIGSATLSSMSSNVDFELHGESATLKQHELASSSLNHHFTTPQLGRMTWKRMDSSSAASLGLATDSKPTMALKDQKGVCLATVRGVGKSEHQLDMWVPCDEAVLEITLLTAMIVDKKKKDNAAEIKVAFQVMGAVAGM